MDRKMVLAFVLILLVITLPSILFPPAKPMGADPETIPSPEAREPPAEPTGPPPPAVTPPPVASRPTVAIIPDPSDSVGEEFVAVESPLYRFTFSTRGARLVGAELKQYASFAPGDPGRAQLIPDESEFLATRFVRGRDTVDLAGWVFEPSADRLDVGTEPVVLSWVGRRGAAVVVLDYSFRPGHYIFDVRGEVRGVGSEGGLILVGLGPGFRLIEADSASDFRSYGLVTKARSTENTSFSSLDPAERNELSGPFEWVALKTKYFLAALLTIEEGNPRFGGAVAVGGARSAKNATRLHAAASLAAPGGFFAYSAYVGPQEFRRLAAIGHDFSDINPYGWVFRPIIQPFAALIVRILLWMHETLSLAYGWVLVLFGIMVRILLWPLNQKAMRSSIAMQAIQPEIKAIQEKFKKDPQKLQKETLKLYKEHGVNPLGGCLPLLIPMPVLFALFFVFANTIEFRGVPFLWLPDLSRADPLYIIPLVMGVSMFGLSKVGQIGVPPNPQTKMMLYFMPIMFTVLFVNFASGLNLYYAVSNIASIPQQWLVAQQRLKRLRA